MTPQTVNANYEPTQNKFIVPAGVLNPVFFYKTPGIPDLINFAAIGTVIGHELTHGFDDQGAQYDEYGNLHNWWNNATMTEFDKRTKCLVDQYNAYPGPKFQREWCFLNDLFYVSFNLTEYSVGLNVQGDLTLGENIADNGGIRASYQAYKTMLEAGLLNEPKMIGFEDLSSDQLFYIGFGQVWCSSYTKAARVKDFLDNPHSPIQFRVIGPLSNSPEFAKAFNCPTGSNMNPSKKCVVW